MKIRPHLGWREWVSLPDLKVSQIKVKIDSGARTSALHAEEIHYFRRGHKKMVRFKIFPRQNNKNKMITAEEELKDQRSVRSSAGHVTERPVIVTTLKIGEFAHEIELTLVDRDIMGFRMLLGRQAMKGRYIIDPSRSFLIGKKKVRKEKNGK